MKQSATIKIGPDSRFSGQNCTLLKVALFKYTREKIFVLLGRSLRLPKPKRVAKMIFRIGFQNRFPFFKYGCVKEISPVFNCTSLKAHHKTRKLKCAVSH